MECQRTYSRQHYTDNKEEHNSRRYQNKKERRVYALQVIRELKKQPCTDCDQTYPYYVMDFDHLGDKEFLISRGINEGRSLKRVLEEIAKCELVCANCHRIRTFTRMEEEPNE